MREDKDEGTMLNIVLLAAMACESLTGLQLPHTTITSSTLVAAADVAAHCDVRGVARPTKDSEIKFSVWLPPIGWNGKYLQYGNGGWAGAIPFRQMADALKRGYAVAGTDDGHEGGGNAEWALGHPEKLIDFGYRAVHETSVQSKAIVRAFYGRDIQKSRINWLTQLSPIRLQPSVFLIDMRRNPERQYR